MALKRFAKFVVSLFVLLALQRAFESGALTRGLELGGYILLQAGLDRFASRPEQRLVVVDISDLRQKDGVTPRGPLLDLFSKLKDAQAKAIGVDIDFSPEDKLFVAPNDPSFFDSCRRLGIPVFLGVARTAGSSRAAWLGKAEFADLAAAIVIPHDTGTIPEKGAPAPYPVYIPRLGSDIPGASTQPDHLRSLGVALASASREHVEHDLMEQHSFFTESIAERSIVQGRVIPEFTVDDRFVEHLRKTSIAATWDPTGKLTTSFDRHSVGDSLVLVGDVKGASQTDVFATIRTKGASGVLLHASATMTLLKGPASVFNELTRAGMDILFAVLGVGAALSFKKRFDRHSHPYPWLPRFVGVPLVTSFSIALLITGVATFLVLGMRVLWFDWVAVIVSVAVHEFFDEPTKFVTNRFEAPTPDEQVGVR